VTLGAHAWAQGSAGTLEAPTQLQGLLRQHVDALRETPAIQDEGERLRVVRQTRRQVEGLLATEGYFSPTVTIDGGLGSPLRLVVDPGLRVQVTAVAIEFRGAIAQDGEQAAARRQTLREGWRLRPGQPFRQPDWEAAKQNALRQLLTRDYAAATIADSRAEVDPETGSAALTVVYDSGPAFVLGPLEVSGLETHSSELVARYNTLAPGEPYDQQRLLDLQTRLQNTPYFAAVTVDVDPDPARADPAPLRVQVREARSKRVGVGAGYSSNTGARGELTFRHSNLWDRAWDLASGLRIEQKRQFGYADVHVPPTQKDYRDSVGVLGERSDIQGLVTQRVGVGAVRTRVRERVETRWSLGFQRERREPQNGVGTINSALTLNGSWTYRAVDDVLDPRRGYVIHLQLGGASQALLSDRSFVRGYGRYQHYFPVLEQDALILRAELGLTAAQGREGIPQEFLFRSGGAQSVRGYSYQSLGVREGDAVVGARKLAVAGTEYVHWFNRSWGGAAFYDVGNAWDDSADARLFVGYGLGGRWRSPAGPLALDLGYGHHDRKLRLHFSVAIAF
jgi:translocation and assembly module TamA